MGSYLSATRHPWPTLLLLLPLIAIYELGIVYLAGPEREQYRNGADAWLRHITGIKSPFVVPGAVLGLWGFLSVWRWTERPPSVLGVCLGMVIESVMWALGLWVLSRNFGLMLDHFGIVVSTGPIPNEATLQILTYMGAGIYEEIIFRLVIFGGIVFLLRLAFLPVLFAVPIAMVASALLFAAAHHIGPYGEKMNAFVFLFRTAAGLYFAMLYQFRGFGVAVGAHAGYDVIVGLNVI